MNRNKIIIENCPNFYKIINFDYFEGDYFTINLINVYRKFIFQVDEINEENLAKIRKVDMILDGGACSVGVESTIIDVTGKNIVILRAGGTSKEDLEKFLNEKVFLSDGDPNKPSAPGQLLKNYAPEHPLRINAATRQPGEFFIGFGKIADCDLNLSPNSDLCEAAANLFAFLREADQKKDYKGLAISPIPETGLGLAINDRIRRASYKA